MIFRPKERSTKKTNRSGGEGKLASDGFFDVSPFALIIMGQFVNGKVTNMAAITGTIIVLLLNVLLIAQTFGVHIPGLPPS